MCAEQRTKKTRPREFKYAECMDTSTIAVLKIDIAELFQTRYFGVLYVGRSGGITVSGPCSALRARIINSKFHLGQKPFNRLDVSHIYFDRHELVEHAIATARQWKIVEYLVIGTPFDDPNDCEVVWRRHPQPAIAAYDQLPF